MARNKTSKFGAADGFNFDNEYAEKGTPEEKNVAGGYEKRTKQISAFVTPSTHQALKELKYKGKIKSSNDLINDLLEKFIQENI